MSQTVENRVVQMDFENKDFERNAQQSLNTIDELKKSLDFDNASKNLTALSNAASKFDLSGIGNAVDQIGEKFSYLKYAGLIALGNLVDGAVNAGKRFASALTGPIISGGWNRASNLEQANFMMKGLLKTDEAVAEVMADVQESVDGTAYSLDAAAKVAAQFATSGLKAGENMLPALKAVAGTAAMTNSSFEDIGQIFTTVAGQGKLTTYQMRQLEFRGLNVAATLGEQLGKSEAEIRDMVTKGKISFEMFSEAMDSAFGEHAKEANNTFTGAMANIRSALGRIGAEFATPFIKNAIPVLNAFRVAVNDVKKTMGPIFTEAASIMEKLSYEFTTRIEHFSAFLTKHKSTIEGIISDIIGSLKNVFGFVTQLIAPIKDAFEIMFPKTSLAYIKKISVAILEFTKSLSVSERQATILRNIFAGLFSIFDTARVIIVRIIDALKPLAPVFSAIGKAIEYVALRFSYALLKLNDFVKNSEIIQKVFDKIKSVAQSAASKLKDVFSNLFDKTEGFNWDYLKESFSKIVEFIKKCLDEISDITHNFGEVLRQGFKAIPDLIDAIFKGIGKALSGAGNTISEFLNSSGFKSLMELVKDGGIVYAIYSIGRALSRAGGMVDSFFGSLNAFQINIFGGLGKGLNNLSLAVQGFARVELIKAIAKAILEIAAALFILSSVNVDNLDKVVQALSGLFMVMTGAVAGIMFLIKSMETTTSRATKATSGFLGLFKKTSSVVEKVGVANLAQKLTAAAGLIMSLATSMLLLAGAVRMLSKLDYQEIMKGLISVITLMGTMTASVAIIQKVGNLDKAAKYVYSGFLKIALAVGILTLAMKSISSMDTEALVNSIFALTIVIGELTASALILSRYGTKVGGGLLVIASSVLILSGALRLISRSVNFENVIPVVGSLSTIMLLIVEITKKLNTQVNMTQNGILKLFVIAESFTIMANAIVKISLALLVLSGVKIEKLGSTLALFATGIAGLVAPLIILLKVSDTISGMDEGLKLLQIAGALDLMAVALGIMSASLVALSLIPVDRMEDRLNAFTFGVVAMTGSLALLLAMMKSIGEGISIGYILAAGGALVMAGGAIAAMSAGISMIALCDVDKINAATIALGSILLLLEVLYGIAAGTADLSLFGDLALLAVGQSMMMVAASAIELSLAVALVAKSVKLITDIKPKTITDLFDAVSYAVDKTVKSMNSFMITLAKWSVVMSLISPLTTLFGLSMIVVASALVPMGIGIKILAEGIDKLTDAFIKAGDSPKKFANGIKLVSAGLVEFYRNLAYGLTEGLRTFVTALASVAPEISEGIKTVLVTAATVIPEAIVVILDELCKTIADHAGSFAESFVICMTSVMTVLAEYTPQMAKAGNDLFLAIMDAMTEYLPVAVDKMITFVIALVDAFGNAMNERQPDIQAAIDRLLENIKQSSGKWTAYFLELGRKCLLGFIQGLTDLIGLLISLLESLGIKIGSKVEEMINSITDKLTGIKDEFINAGKDAAAGFANGLTDGTAIGRAVKAAWDLGKASLASLKEAIRSHSPSLDFYEVGDDGAVAGYVNGILDNVGDAENAGSLLGLSSLTGLKNSVEGGTKDIGSILDGLVDKGNGTIEKLDNYMSQVAEWSKKRTADTKAMIAAEQEYQRIQRESNAVIKENQEAKSILENLYQRGLITYTEYNNAISDLNSKIAEHTQILIQADSEIDALESEYLECKDGITGLSRQLAIGKITQQEFNRQVSEAAEKYASAKEKLDALDKAYANGQVSQHEYANATKGLKIEIDNCIGSVEELQAALSDLYYAREEERRQLVMNEQAYKNGNKTYGEFYATDRKLLANIQEKDKVLKSFNFTLGKNKEETDKAKEANDGYSKSLEGTGKAAKSAKNELEDLKNSLKSTLQSQMDMFSKFEQKQAMSKEEMLENMRSQIKGVTAWAADINKLYERGIDQGLLQKLTELGPEGRDKVAAFLSMTSDELAEANQLWVDSLAIQDFLPDYLMNTMQQAGMNTALGLAEGLTGPASETARQAMGQFAQNVEGGYDDYFIINSPSELMKEKAMWMMLGLQEGLNTWAPVTVYPTIQAICMTLIYKVCNVFQMASYASRSEVFYQIGMNVVQGLADGIRDHIGEAVAAAQEMAQAVTDAVKLGGESEGGFEVNSPSHVFQRIGHSLDEGLALGVKNGTGMVINSVENMATESIEAMKSTIAMISSMVTDEFEDPVITPILDLSNVQAGARKLNSVLTQNAAYAASGSMNGLQNEQPNAKFGNTFIQNNYSPKALSRIDIYRDTKNLFSRAKVGMI